MLKNTKALVLDEVDRLLRLPGKYATQREREQHERHPRPAALLLEAASKTAGPDLQTIAASATVGRSLRREMGRLLGATDKEVKEGVSVIRPTITLAEAAAEAAADVEEGVDAGGDTEGAATGTGRAVTVPSSISHSYIACVDDSPGYVRA